MKITGNEPAMPVIESKDSVSIDPGLTIRQQFAMVAMQGILSKESWAERIHTESGSATLAIDIAQASVKMADLLIEELNKEG